MKYQLFQQLNELNEMLSLQNKKTRLDSDYLEYMVNYFFTYRLSSLIPVDNSFQMFIDYATKEYYKYMVDGNNVSILSVDEQKKITINDSVFGLSIVGDKIYFIELKNGSLRIELFLLEKEFTTYLYDPLAVSWIIENNLISIKDFLNPSKVTNLVKSFERNYLKPDFLEITNGFINYNMLSEKIKKVNGEYFSEHLFKTNDPSKCFENLLNR